jgi:Ca-activated chloride channel family protein
VVNCARSKTKVNMKLRILLLFAAALISAASLALSAKTVNQSTATAGSVQLRIDVDRAVLPAESTERAVIKIALDAIRPPRSDRRLPVNLALVIDRSSSMSGEKIVKAREAALEAVRRLEPDDIVALVAYDSRVETLVPAQRVGDRRRLEAAICSIEATGMTALHGGVMRGAEEVRQHIEDRRYVNRIILLSDGQANVGPRTPEELGRYGTSLMHEGISVSTVGLGLGFNEDLMTRLAQRSHGNTYFVEHSSDLPRIFAAELGDVLSIVARRVVIEVVFPEGVRPLCFVGREGVIRGQKAELTLNQLYGGQEKFALVEVEVSPAKAGLRREIARASVSYEDALDQRNATLAATRTVEFSTNTQTVISSADHRVQADYAANVMAGAKDEAVALVDSNRRDEAGALLRQKAAELAKIGTTYSNFAVQSVAAPAAAEADRIERDGLDNSARKNYRAESAQTRNQQSSR